jgi:hypothetical protein
MSEIDFSKIAKDVIGNSRESTILAYREFYETHLEPVCARVTLYKIEKFLSALERQPNFFHDPEAVSLTNEIIKFSEDSFGSTLLTWFRKNIPEVDQINKSNRYSSNVIQTYWLQHRAKLLELKDRIRNFGLHPDIEKREIATYARYNVVIEYRSDGAKKSNKECKPLMKLADLEQQVLISQRSQKPLQLNGRYFQASEIKRFTITRCLLLDEEVRLYKAKHGCNTDLSFCTSFPAVTDEMIQNPHLQESADENKPHFIDQSRIDAFRAYSGTTWDLVKLIQLCEELNQNFHGDNFYAVAYLSRALIDHVPPILGCKNFDEVANNYSGAPSFRKAMEHLNKTLKHIADYHIHKQVSPKLPVPTMTQVDFRQDLDWLLAELLTKL